MGSKIPVITKAIKTGTIKLENGKYVVPDGENTIVLNKEDILVSYIAKDNKPVMSDEQIVVSLDLTITDELKEEGVAREVVRNVQDARKQLDLNITDKIKLCLEGNVPQNFVDYICGETLANLENIADQDADMKLETDGVVIKIKKHN